MVRASAVVFGSLLLGACPQQSNPSLQSLAPIPLPPLEASRADAGAAAEPRDAWLDVESTPVWGDDLPAAALAMHVEAATVSIGGRTIDRLASSWSEQVLAAVGKRGAVLLDSDPERYLADFAPLLALLAASGIEVWLRHPDGPVAFKVLLFDNARFESWLNEPKPGKIRVIQRADGFELQTNIGKMAGSDPNGPTVPTRGGKLDIARLRRGLELLQGRFPSANESCLVPSFGSELPAIARALSGYYRGKGRRIFDVLCLVYPPSGQPPAAATPR